MKRATAAAATLGVLSVGGAVWLLPLGVWVLVEARPALRVRTVAVAAAVLVVLALPAVAEAARFLGDGHLGSWRDEGRLEIEQGSGEASFRLEAFSGSIEVRPLAKP